MQKIGLEAVLQMGNFNKGMKEYTKGVAGIEKSTDTAGKGLKSFGDKFGSLRSGIGTIAPVIAGAVAAFYTLKKALDFGREGAVIQQTTDSFNDLMESLGISPSILGDMSRATLGTVDDMTLMSSTMTLVAGTSDEMSRAMVLAAPKLLEVAKAAVKLKPSLGSVADVYNSVTLGIKRNSPLLIDNANIIVKVGAANEAMAEKLGKSVEALSAEDKQMALLEATMEAGNRMIEQVGGSVDSATDSYEQLTTQVTNLTNEVKRKANPSIAAATKTILTWVDALLTSSETIGELSDDIMATTDSYEDYNDALFDAAIASGYLNEAEVERAQSQLESGKQIHRTIAAMGVLTEAQYNSLQAVNKLAGGIDNFSEAMDPFPEMQREAARATLALAMAETDAIATTADLAAVISSDATVAAAGFTAQLDILHAAIAGAVSKAFDTLTKEIWELRGSLASGTITQEEYTASIQKATQAFQDNTNAIIFNIAEKQILDALEKGLIEDVNASGTAYDEATIALYAMAEGLGIVDEGTLGLTKAVIDQTQAYISGRGTLDDWVGGLGDLSGQLAGAAMQGRDLNTVIHGFPSYKQIVIETYYKTRGTPPPGAPAGVPEEPVPYQSGGTVGRGQLTLVGEAGPELFVPASPGTIIPNMDLGMSLPGLLGMGGGGSTFGPTIIHTMNPTINNGMDVAEFEARTLATVQKAIRGT